jgi:hypothetical protein
MVLKFGVVLPSYDARRDHYASVEGSRLKNDQ